MKWFFVVFLVLLRLAIGWHFLIEGTHKIESGNFSSEAYLRESTGPLSHYFHQLAGDKVAELYELKPAGDNPKSILRLSPRLLAQCQAMTETAIARMGKDGERAAKAGDCLQAHLDGMLEWLENGQLAVKKPGPGVQSPVETTVAPISRAAQYRELQTKITQTKRLIEAEFGLAAAMEQTKPLKAELASTRVELANAMNERISKLQGSLDELLSEQEKLGGPIKAKLPMAKWSRLDWIDRVLPWALVVVGGCLILGLFTRTACVAGAGLLLAFYLAMPPFPGLPENLKSEGHYLFVNKNMIELLALLTIASTPSARWVGIDGLIHAMRRRRKPSSGD